MRRFFHALFQLIAALLVALSVLLGVMLWQVGRDLPPPACRWLETRMSQGPVSVLFDRATFSLWRGVQLQRVRIYPKRKLGSPMFEADQIQLKGRIYRSRQPAEWIDSVTFKGLEIDPFLAWPVVDSQGLSLRDWTTLFDPSQPAGALFARPVTITIEDSTIFGIVTERVTFDLRSQIDRLVIDDARVDIKTPRFRERIDGEAAYDFYTRRLHVNLRGTLTPDVIERLCLFLDGKTAVEVFHDFEDYSAPLNIHGSMWLQVAPPGSIEPAPLDMRMTIDGAGMRYRGVPLTRLQLSLQWLKGDGERKLTLAPVVAHTKEGQVELAIAYFPARHETDFTFHSTAGGSTLLQALQVDTVSLASNLQFQTAPVVTLAGTIAGRRATSESRINGRVVCEDLTIKDFQVTQARADIQVHGTNRLDITDFVANFYGGSVTGRASAIRLSPAAPLHVDVALAAERINLANLMASRGKKSAMGGQLSAQLELHLPWSTNHLHRVAGAGQLAVTDGTIMRVQLFAGLTDFLGRNVPGMDSLLMQSNAHLPFVVTNGVVTVRDFQVEGNLFSLTAQGTCRLTEPGYPLDGITKLRFFKQKTLVGMLARLVTLPVSKMMEFRMSGPLTHPTWNYIGIFEQIRDTFRGRPVINNQREPETETR